jgi:hypothetical protein
VPIRRLERPTAVTVARSQVDPYAPETVAVYRLYNHCGALLYVGISHNPKERFQQHAKDKAWWTYVEHWVVRWHPDRAAALAAEAQAIIEESPAFNASGVCIVAAPNCLALWRERLEAPRLEQRPAAVDLTGLYMAFLRIATLPPGARTAWTADEAERVYRMARSRAGWWSRRLHGDFLRWRETHRTDLNRAAQRRDRERARLTGRLATHTPSMALERPL